MSCSYLMSFIQAFQRKSKSRDTTLSYLSKVEAGDVVLYITHISLPEKCILDVTAKVANNTYFLLHAGTILTVANSTNDSTAI